MSVRFSRYKVSYPAVNRRGGTGMSRMGYLSEYTGIVTGHGHTARGEAETTARTAIPDGVSDVELFVLHLEGDHDALMMLFERHNQRLWLYCSRMLGDAQLASDAVQEVWERVIRLREKGAEAPRKPSSFLFTIARNFCLNLIRSRKRETSLGELEEYRHPTTGIREASRLEELVVRGLEQLSEAQREVLVLYAYSGYTFEEIAELLDKPRGAIHTTAWRARKRLGKILEELAAEEDRNMPGGTSEHARNNDTE